VVLKDWPAMWTCVYYAEMLSSESRRWDADLVILDGESVIFGDVMTVGRKMRATAECF